MNYSNLQILPHEDEVLPVELPLADAVAIYIKRFLVLVVVVLLNILLFLAYLEIAGIRAVLQK